VIGELNNQQKIGSARDPKYREENHDHEEEPKIRPDQEFHIKVYISAPDDAETTLELRKHSTEMKDTISRYKELRTEFDDQLNELITQKGMLQIQLFKRPN
jgi:hypothetical protein